MSFLTSRVRTLFLSETAMTLISSPSRCLGAEWNSAESSLDGLKLTTSYADIFKQRAVAQYAKEYLKGLARDGFHVLHSSPVFAKPTPFGLTSIRFQVVSKTEITARTCGHHRREVDKPVLIVLGMMAGRTLPNIPINWGACDWIITGGKQVAAGTLCVAKECFLEGTLLRTLGDLNEKTTLVPTWVSVNDGTHEFELTSWADHERLGKKDRRAHWTRGNDTKDYMEYIWEFHDSTSHEHKQSSGDDKSGEYTLSCESPSPFFSLPLPALIDS